MRLHWSAMARCTSSSAISSPSRIQPPMASQLPRQDGGRPDLVGDVLGGADNHPTVEAGAWDTHGVRLDLDVGLPGDPGVDAPRVLRRAVRLLGNSGRAASLRLDASAWRVNVRRMASPSRQSRSFGSSGGCSSAALKRCNDGA
jgi:hypothetical protein